ncbi:MAG: RloB family protein [Gammaproteobacteria bacterium]|nr:RloB family protein [Gammaproteobacteria bacterium]
MGTDNLFHKRKAKGARELKRRKHKRAPYDKVLIVTEGKKTEPEYFNDLKKYYRIHSANIKIDGSGDSSPESVIKYGKKLYEDERSGGDAFDRVYFVFDKDTHLTYPQALDAIKRYRRRRKNTFFAINSVPCFEYWLLLHFIYTTEPFPATGQLSAADQVIRKLKKYCPDYDKSAPGLFTKLYDKLEMAKVNAINALKAADQAGTDIPSTLVHELVEYLQNIKKM